MIRPPFTETQEQRINYLFGEDLLKQLKEMEKSISAISIRDIPKESEFSFDESSLSIENDDISGIFSDAHSFRQEEKPIETNGEFEFGELLDALAFTPQMEAHDDILDESKMEQLADIERKAKAFQTKLELTGCLQHLVALGHFIVKSITAVAAYCASIFVGIAIASFAVSSFPPAIILAGKIIGGVVGAGLAEGAANMFGLTWHSFYSPAHRRAVESASIEKTIQERISKVRDF